MTGWRYIARVAAVGLLVAVAWTGFTTIGQDGDLDCGNAFAPNYAAVTDDGTTVEDEDAFDAEAFAAACRDDVASQRFRVLVLAIAGTGALVIGVSSREPLPGDSRSPGSADG